MLKGEYSDQEVLTLVNKYKPKNIGFNAYTLKSLGKNLKSILKDRSMTNNEIKDLVVDTISNPPEIPENPSMIVDENLEKQKRIDKIKTESEFTSQLVDGKEVLKFSAEGIHHIYCGRNDDFENIGKEEIDDHEDDGRIFKTQNVKRLSDGKMFHYSFVWHPQYPTDYWDNSLTAL